MFPRDYLRAIHDDGFVTESARVSLKVTRPYNFCNPIQRGEWFDIVVALFQYFKSGESKLGFLNKDHPRNMLHKGVEAQIEVEESKAEETNIEDISQTIAETEVEHTSSTSKADPVRRSTRKRPQDAEPESGRKVKR